MKTTAFTIRDFTPLSIAKRGINVQSFLRPG